LEGDKAKKMPSEVGRGRCTDAEMRFAACRARCACVFNEELKEVKREQGAVIEHVEICEYWVEIA
jgi:hypothetical protein